MRPSPIKRGDHVRERGEVARGADAALRGDERHGVGVEQRHERVDHFAADPAVAAAEADQLERIIMRTVLRGKRVAEAAAVAEDEVALELAELVGGDAGLGEQAEAGVDAVDGLAAGDDAIDRGGGGVDRGEGVVGEARGGAAPQVAQRVEGDGAGGEDDHLVTIGKSRPCSRAQSIASS